MYIMYYCRGTTNRTFSYSSYWVFVDCNLQDVEGLFMSDTEEMDMCDVCGGNAK